MPDLYCLRNIMMFLYPLFGYFIYSYFRWPKLIPFIAWIFLILTTWNVVKHNATDRPFSLQRAINYYEYKKYEEKGLIYHPIYIIPKGYGIRENEGEGDRSDNTVFRLLIWQDMIKEMIDNRAWFGMGLSHPLRSRQLEMLGWAKSEWSRDGWISAHNSYLYVIYRIGIFGVIAICGLFYSLVKTFRKDLTMIVLYCCLGYWLIEASYMEIWQLPYYAIPFWVLYSLILRRANGH